MSSLTYGENRVNRDARIRAWRTFFTNLAFDVAAGVAAFLVTVIGNFEWTRTYWITFGLGVAKSVITGIMTYFVRKFFKPSNVP